ncbi:acyl-CoA thioesterase [Teredinibacter waterburyi]|jgi:Predicted thioesterase|uniref:acyl-CoA thioesterase n=1 Tax=Teredinibacter waterburyi TaxID=1500538 RepID=UPI00165F58F1|nr:thioesterase family protein [Teredinibacter waterburyi]
MIFETILQPRFCDADILGHVSNTIIPVWFEESRRPIFLAMQPEINIKNWAFVIAHINVDFHLQTFIEQDVLLRTHVSKIGTKSLEIYHEAWQQGRKTASGTAVLVHFDFKTQTSQAIPEEILQRLYTIVEDLPSGKE